MPEVSPLAVVVGAVAGVVLGAGWYAATASALTRFSPDAPERPPALVLGVELLRSGVLAAAVTAIVTATGTTGVLPAALVGLLLWAAFPLVLWIGAVVHEGTPWRLAVVHAGDWLVKLPALAVIAVLLT